MVSSVEVTKQTFGKKVNCIDKIGYFITIRLKEVENIKEILHNNKNLFNISKDGVMGSDV